jgi:hypothetical protein
MRAALLLKERRVLGEARFVDVTIWRVPKPIPGCTHPFKYRLALVVDELCVLRFDNEAGKGDHKHAGMTQAPYAFTTLDQLVSDFWRDVENWSSA